MGEGRELGGSAVSTGAVKATSTLCVCVFVCVLWLTPIRQRSLLFVFRLSHWINVFEASHQSFTFRLNPLSRHVSGREAFPSDSTEPIPSSPFFFPTRGHVSKSRIGFSLSPFRKRTPLRSTVLVWSRYRKHLPTTHLRSIAHSAHTTFPLVSQIGCCECTPCFYQSTSTPQSNISQDRLCSAVRSAKKGVSQMQKKK